MNNLVKTLKNLWDGWTDFAPKFLLAVLAFALLTVFVQLSQSFSKAADACDGTKVRFDVTRRVGGHGETTSILQGKAYNDCDKEVKFTQLWFWCDEVNGTNTCGDYHARPNEEKTIPAHSSVDFDLQQKNGNTPNGDCGASQVDAFFGSHWKDGNWPVMGVAAWVDKSCKVPVIVCQGLALEKLAGGPYRIKATVSGYADGGAQIEKYGYDFNNDGNIDDTTTAPDNAKKHDFPGFGTYTVRGYVIDKDGKKVGGSGACQKSITIQGQPNYYCDNTQACVACVPGTSGYDACKSKPACSTSNDCKVVQPNNYCGADNTCVQCIPGTPGYDACKNKPSCSSNAQCQPQPNYYCGANYTCDQCVPGTAGYNDCKNKPSCSSNAQCQPNVNYYCGANNTCDSCVPGTAGYDACKNKPSCSSNTQCQVQPNYFCDANYACSACVPGTAGYNDCKNKPTCTSSDQCKVTPNYFCDSNETCSQCVPGTAGYNDCKNKPTCTSSDQCKPSQKFTCQDNSCKVCTGGDCLNQPSCSTQMDCQQSYYSCTTNNTCQKFYGSGTSTCNPGSTDCQVHSECDGTSCKQVTGAYRGGALCSSDSMCQPVVNQSTYCDWLFVDPQTGNVGVTVNAQLSGHTLNGGTISQYRFNFGDGTGDTVQSGDKLSHSFGQTGTYVISGAVIDNRGVQAGGSGACQKVVQVVPSGVTPPPPSGKGGVPSTGAESLFLPLFSLLGTFGWAIKRIRGN